MSLAMFAKLFGVPDDLVSQLPDLAAKIPDLLQHAERIVTTAEARVTAMEQTMMRLENKINILGAAFIEFMEKNNVHVADTRAVADGSNHSEPARPDTGNVV